MLAGLLTSGSLASKKGAARVGVRSTRFAQLRGLCGRTGWGDRSSVAATQSETYSMVVGSQTGVTSVHGRLGNDQWVWRELRCGSL